jgi:hypothetical protein
LGCSVYASQKLGLRSGGLDVPFDIPINGQPGRDPTARS